MCQANSSDAEASDRSEGAALQSGDGEKSLTRPVRTRIVERMGRDPEFCQAILDYHAERVERLTVDVTRLRAAMRDTIEMIKDWAQNEGFPLQNSSCYQRLSKALKSSIEERSDESNVQKANIAFEPICSPDTTPPKTVAHQGETSDSQGPSDSGVK